MNSQEPLDLAEFIKSQAQGLGFTLSGIVPAARPDTLDYLHHWLEQGMQGEMEYISRRMDAYAHPEQVMPGVRSVVMLAMHYGDGNAPRENEPSGLGQIAKYARGSLDYHDLIRRKLKQLIRVIRELKPDSYNRGVVDTAPLLERDFGRQAGLGWFGKNTMLINKHAGSFFFLAALLTDLELPPDEPHELSHCGTCTRCLDVCPTDAFDAPYVLDARKCISYLTIELRNSAIPVEMRSQLGDWLFGCDLCQDVCPWNRKAPGAECDELGQADNGKHDAAYFLKIDEEQFRRQFRNTPLYRTGRSVLARNAAIVLGNSHDRQWIPILEYGLYDSAPMVAEACRWAIQEILNAQTRESGH